MASAETHAAVRWRRSQAEISTDWLPHGALVLRATDIVAHCQAAGSLEWMADALAGVGTSRTTLVATGAPPPGIDRVLTELQLEYGVGLRRALHEAELADMLAAMGEAMVRRDAAPPAEAFLSGLSSSDVLLNKKVPRGPSEAWLGALKQILPERSAQAVFDAFPTPARLYQHYRAAASPESVIADLRVGERRLGPARSRRLHRVLMATREQAGELLAPAQ